MQSAQNYKSARGKEMVSISISIDPVRLYSGVIDRLISIEEKEKEKKNYKFQYQAAV